MRPEHGPPARAAAHVAAPPSCRPHAARPGQVGFFAELGECLKESIAEQVRLTLTLTPTLTLTLTLTLIEAPLLRSTYTQFRLGAH